MFVPPSLLLVKTLARARQAARPAMQRAMRPATVQAMRRGRRARSRAAVRGGSRGVLHADGMEVRVGRRALVMGAG
jgi:hypothetical protein